MSEWGRRAAFLSVVCASIVATILAAPSSSAVGSRTGVVRGATSAIPPFAGPPSSTCPDPLPGVQQGAPPVASGVRTVALTFDDGPGQSTQQIIDILESFHVRATFFNVGQQYPKFPVVSQAEWNDGFLIGDHTIDEANLPTLSPSQQAAEIDGPIHDQRALFSSSPCVIRPPYGLYDATTLAIDQSRRLTTWTWNDYTDDDYANGSPAQKWVNLIIHNAEVNGIDKLHPVVVLHNVPAVPATVAALPVIIRYFLTNHYTFVDLLGRSGPPGTCGPSTPFASRAPGTRLGRGAVLQAGDAVTSPSGQFVLTMNANGNLVLSEDEGPTVWSTHTAGNPGAVASVDATGDLVVKGPTGATLWAAHTGGHPGANLVVRDNGTAVVTAGGAKLWSSPGTLTDLASGGQLQAGWQLRSPNGRCVLEQLPDGELVLTDSTKQVLWSTETSNLWDATATQLTPNGDLEQVEPAGNVVWQSWTSQSTPTRLEVTNSGRLEISTTGGTILWATP